MVIGERLRQLREAKHLSQGDVEKRTGLLRCYTSRVEHGATIPSIETLQKYAHALEVPLYRFFHEADKLPAEPPVATKREPELELTGKEQRELRAFASAIRKMGERERRLLLAMATRMARRQYGS